MTTIDADIVSRLRCVREDLDTAQELLEIGPSYRRAARAYALAALGLLDSTLRAIEAHECTAAVATGQRDADVATRRDEAATDRDGEGSPQGQDAPDGSTPSDGPRTGRGRRDGFPLLLTGPGGSFLQAKDADDLLD